MPETLGAERPSFIKELAAISLGGAIGACLRYAVSVGVSFAGLHVAMGAAITNIVGSFLLGLLVGRLEAGHPHPLARPFLTVGVFGSFTTFSALAFDNRRLASETGEGFALIHLAGTVLLGLAAFVLGETLDGSDWGADPEGRSADPPGRARG